MLTINMLGKVTLSYQNECISDKLSSKLAALICLLVLNKNRNMSKEKLISYLWPDSNDEAAKSNLRFNLWSIKRLIPQSCDGEDFILSGKDYCRINEKYSYYCDRTLLDRFKISRLEKVEDLIQLKALFKGDFLEGLYLRNCNDFNEMILFERVVCQNKQVEILEKLIDLYDEQGRFEEELEVLNEVAAIEPYNEKFACRAIKIYGKLGNRTAAINYYKNFEVVLRRNLSTSPNNELKLLYKELLESPGSLQYEHKGKERLCRKEIEILLDGLKEVEYFGIAEVIDGIMKSAEKKYILDLGQSDILDLGYIYNGFRLEYDKKSALDFPQNIEHVPPVRISLAFLSLLRHTAERYDIRIRMKSTEELDPVSRSLILRLEKMKIPNVRIEY